MDNKNEFFERISNEYSMLLLNWAHKKTGNRTDAEDLAQEVLTQVFRSAQKEQSIEKPDNFVWKIAHFVWCNYLKKNVVLRSCVSIDSIDYDFLSEEDHAEKYFEEEEMNDKLKKMRLKISNLNYLQREIMIMHYIDELPLKSISQKLNITEASVKWHLYDTRKKLKREINEMNNTNFVYRPGKLHMAISGNPGPKPDAYKINESLTKQNICLACAKEPKTPDELAEMLGIAKAYIEYDLQWLVEKQFVKKDGGRYVTMFSIKEHDFDVRISNLFLENKSKFSDVIVEKFISKKDKIKAIGFHGSEQPVEKLLWLFIYRFIEFTLDKVIREENKYPQPERPIMPDGGQYFPLGFDRSESNDNQVEFLNEKYKGIGKWNSNGAMYNPGDKVALRWLGLYNAGKHNLEMLFSSYSSSKNYNAYQVLLKTLEKDFNIENLNEDEKAILSEIISYRWVSKKDNKIVHNFSVFTKSQERELLSVFDEIYSDINEEIHTLLEEIEKLCRANLPKHLDYYLNYHIYMTFYSAMVMTTGFAYYDGKLYDPKDDVECGLLTFQVIKKDDSM